jgi:FAD/FMN-containing dehydrogenase
MKSAHAAGREVAEVRVSGGRLVEALSRDLPGDRLVVDPDVLAAMSHDEAEWAPVGQAAFEQFLDAAIALGGTVTGEHGVGILKRMACAGNSTRALSRCRPQCATRSTPVPCST